MTKTNQMTSKSFIISENMGVKNDDKYTIDMIILSLKSQKSLI